MTSRSARTSPRRKGDRQPVNDLFKLAYDDLGVPASMVEARSRGPLTIRRALLIPGCPGSVFVALRPDNTVNVRMIAEGAPTVPEPRVSRPSFSPNRVFSMPNLVATMSSIR